MKKVALSIAFFEVWSVTCFPSHGEGCGAALSQHVLLVNPRSS